MILPETDKWNRPDRYYDQALLAYIGLIFDSNKACVDIGANIGYVTSFLATRSRGVVFAIEPGTSNIACLKKNILGMENVVVVPYVADEISNRNVSFINGGTVTDHVAISNRSKKIEIVKTVMVDEIVGEIVTGFVKIDVEGYEVKVLRGARRIFERDRPICVIEVVDSWLRRFGHDRGGILSYFHSLDYQSPVDRFGRQSDDATDLIFAPKNIYLPRLYLAYEKDNKRRIERDRLF